MRKGIIAVVAAAVLFAIGALAASFSLNAEDVSSGADDVNACTDTATVRWLVDDSDAFSGPPAEATFMITEAQISAPGCASQDFVLAIQVGEGETLCTGELSGGAADVTIADDCDSGDLNVSDVTGAALLIGDAEIALQTTSGAGE